MGKKDKGNDRTRVSETRELTHSPFAGLALNANSSAPDAPQPQAAVEPKLIRERSRGRLVLRRETKHRGGKAVIVVAGFAEPADTLEAIEALATELRQLLGCGGTVTREHEIILQGDHPTKIAEHLRAENYRVVGLGC